MFTKTFVQAQIKENIKAPRHWPLWGEFAGDQWIPHTKGQLRENVSILWHHDEECDEIKSPKFGTRTKHF